MDTSKLINPNQIQSTKEGYPSLFEQLNFGKFNAAKGTAAPTLLQEVVATEGQSLFSVPHGSFVMGDDSLQVYVNGMYMRRGQDKDYIELSQTEIQFNYPLEKDEVVVFRVSGGTSGPHLNERVATSNGQTLIELAKSYTPGNGSLQVFKNGLLQQVDRDYVELSSKQIQLTSSATDKDVFIFRSEGVPSVELKYKSSEYIAELDDEGRLIKETYSGEENIVHEYEYDTLGRPSRMITRETGYIITKRYEWNNPWQPSITTTAEGV